MIDFTEYPPCPLCGQSFGMEHRDPTRLCLDCECCGDCDDNNLCIARGCVKPNPRSPGPAFEEAQRVRAVMREIDASRQTGEKR